MITWFTSDLHLGHANIIRYCDRPFANVAEMNRALVDRWNEVVGADDTVWVLGDHAMGPIVESLALTAQLKGYKILLAGNHDRCWYGHGPKSEIWIERYLAAGFAEIRQGTQTYDMGGRKILLNHFPYVGDSHDEDRFNTARPRDDGEWLLHGHVHERWDQNDRMINVGVDVRNFRPMPETEVMALIAAGPAPPPPNPDGS
ncbi:MAG: metallophosphoesterase [Aquihabitans sp.]